MQQVSALADMGQFVDKPEADMVGVREDLPSLSSAGVGGLIRMSTLTLSADGSESS